ncbi:MAG: CyaY protein [Pseudohongiellaceae bacterium]|jgi:CyaY protein
MPDATLAQQIAATLNALVERLDELEHDGFDVDSTDGKVTLEFDDGTMVIVNRQAAADQIWLAEPRGGWHFDWDGTSWLCDKRGDELLAALETLLEAKLGERIALR